MDRTQPVDRPGEHAAPRQEFQPRRSTSAKVSPQELEEISPARAGVGWAVAAVGLLSFLSIAVMVVLMASYQFRW